MGAAKHVLRYLAGSVNFPITYKRGGFKLTTYTDANWRGNPDNGKSTSSYIMMLANSPISFKVGLQSLTAQSIMEAELVAAAPAMKESLFCRKVIVELGFTEGFRSVPVYVDNTSALHVAGNRTFSPRAKHIALRYFFVQELVKEGKVNIHFVRQDGATTRRFGNETSQKASSPLPHQAHQRFQSLNGRFTCVSYSCNVVHCKGCPSTLLV